MSYESVVLADGPIFLWLLNETSGTTAADATGNGNTGTYSGGYTQGAAGPAFQPTATKLDGSSGLVYEAAPGTSPSTFSAECWFKSTGNSIPLAGFSNSQTGGSGSSYDRCLYLDSSGQVGFYVWAGGSGGYFATSSSAYNDGNWHHVVATFGSSVQKLYVDGVLVATTAAGAPGGSYSGYWLAGSVGGTDFVSVVDLSSAFFSGTMGDFAVYPTVLSQTQVTNHFTAGQQWKVLQSISVLGYGGQTATLSNNLSAGTKLIVAYYANTAGYLTGISDGNGHAFTRLAVIVGGGGAGPSETSLWELDTPSADVGTKPTITATMSAGTNSNMIVQEVAGLAPGTTASLDGSAGTISDSFTYYNGSIQSFTSPTYSSTAAGEYLVSIQGFDYGAVIEAPATGTLDPSSTLSGTEGVALAYKASTGGAENFPFQYTVLPGSETGGQIVVAFKVNPIVYNAAGSTAVVGSAGGSTNSFALTIPAGVKPGDTCFYAVMGGLNGSAPNLSVATTGTALNQIGTTQTVTGFFNFTFAVYWFEASTVDPGKIITATYPGTNDWEALLLAYTGANGTPIDVYGFGTDSSFATSWTNPSETTGIAGDWGIQISASVTSDNEVVTFPPGTLRANAYGLDYGGNGQCIAALDTNGGVSLGSVIGGGSWSVPANNRASLYVTIGLKPASGSPAGSGLLMASGII